jgi:uncharacterized membrane protein
VIITINTKCQKEIIRIDCEEGGDTLGRIEKSIEIKASPEKVWEMLAFDRVLEWQEAYKDELKNVEYTSEVRTPEDKFRVGASAHGIPKKKGEYNFEITESLENEKLAHRLNGKIRALGTYILEPVEKGTKFTVVTDYEMPWGVLGKILELLFIRRVTEKEIDRDLKNLKSILEK